MRDPNPTVILIPGVGMIAWGKNKSESRVTAEFYNAAVEVMRGAEALGGYIALPQQEAFDIEYWKLEEAKLQRMPPEKEFAGTSSWSSARAAVSARRPRTASPRKGRMSSAPTSAERRQRPRAGTYRPLRCGHRRGGYRYLRLWPRRRSRRRHHEARKRAQAVRAGRPGLRRHRQRHCHRWNFRSPDTGGYIPDDKWDLTFAVNVTGGYLVADEARRIWEAQRLKGTLV
jgi:hypothetical protein